MKYKCIKQDYFNKLELGKIYNIINNCLYNNDCTIKLYYIDDWQLKNMFELVEEA